MAMQKFGSEPFGGVPQLPDNPTVPAEPTRPEEVEEDQDEALTDDE